MNISKIGLETLQAELTYRKKTESRLKKIQAKRKILLARLARLDIKLAKINGTSPKKRKKRTPTVYGFVS